MLAMVLIWVATAVANNKLDSWVDAAIDEESKSHFSVTVQYPAFWWEDPFLRMSQAGLHSVLEGLWNNTSESVSIYWVPVVSVGCVQQSEGVWTRVGPSGQSCCSRLAWVTLLLGGKGDSLFAKAGTVPLESSTRHWEVGSVQLRPSCHWLISAPGHCPRRNGPPRASLRAEAETVFSSHHLCQPEALEHCHSGNTHF